MNSAVIRERLGSRRQSASPRGGIYDVCEVLRVRVWRRKSSACEWRRMSGLWSKCNSCLKPVGTRIRFWYAPQSALLIVDTNQLCGWTLRHFCCSPVGRGGVRRVSTYTQAPEVHFLLINDFKQSELILFFNPNSLIVKYTWKYCKRVDMPWPTLSQNVF